MIPHWREPSRRILWCFFKQPHLFSRLSFTYKGCLTFNGKVKEGEKSTGSKGLTQAQLKHGGVNAVDRALERQNKKAPGMWKKALCSIETLRHSSSVVNKSKQSGQSHFTYNSWNVLKMFPPSLSLSLLSITNQASSFSSLLPSSRENLSFPFSSPHLFSPEASRSPPTGELK